MFPVPVIFVPAARDRFVGVLVPLVIVWAVVNTVAWMYGSTQALPWSTVILLFFVWAVRKYF